MNRMGRKPTGSVCLWAGGIAASLLLMAAGSAKADNVPADVGGACVENDALRQVDDCGGIEKGQRKLPSAPASRLDTVSKKKDDAKKGPSGPSIELDAATRRNRDAIKAREFSLLTREVALLKRLRDRTPVKDPRRPDILLRLAETLFEMQLVVNEKARNYDEKIYQCRKKKDAGCAQKLTAEQQKADAELKTVREDTIRAYATLVKDHPNFRRMDEVLFSLAFGLEELRQFDRARQVYYRLIKGFPQSKFVPHAYLSFAEYYFSEGDMKAAVEFYGKVLQFPPDKNPVYGFALYKTAWAAYNLEDFKGALKKFTEVIEFGMANPDARDSENLVRQSRKEMVLPYANVGTPNKALEFFARFTKTKEQSLETFEELGELYFDTGKWENTVSVYQRLISEAPRSDRTCYWQTRVANAVISSKPKVDQVREAERVVDLYDAFSKDNRPAAAVLECKQAATTMLVSLATSWHRESIGAEGQPGTNDRNTMKYAATLYRMTLDKFPDLEKLEFPDIDKRDWPTAYKVQYFYAELLWKMEEWGQCGPAFDRVVEINPKGDYTSDAAYAAVLCYNNLYQQQYQATERQVRRDEERKKGKKTKAAAVEEPKVEPRPFTTLEKGMLNAFQRYVCVVGQGEDLPTIKYRRARIYYEANHFEEAAALFKDIAWNHKDSELGEFAANLYLDSLNVLGTKVKQPKIACINEMEKSIEPLTASYCGTDEAKEGHEDLCGVLGQLQCDVLRKKAESYHASKQFNEAGRTYVRIFKRFPECGQLDEVLYNAAIEFESARLLGRAIQVRDVLIKQYPDKELSKKAQYLVGANYHALAYYPKASEYYEAFASKYPGEDGAKCTDAERTAGTCAVASDALENAVFFRLGMNDEEKALDDAKLFEKNYGKRKPAKASQVFFAIGSLYERKKDWKGVIQHYEKYLKNYKRSGLPQQVLQAHVRIGAAYWAMGDTKRAEGPFKEAVKAWKASEERFSKLEGTDEQREKWFAEGKDAVSEALFHLAEYRYREFKEIKFPEYRGGKSAKSVKDWSEKDFRPWAEKKSKALEVARVEYNAIAPLKIPRWEIAAASRIGEMWRSFVDEFRDAPVPKEIEKDPELFDIYVGSLDEVSEPFVKQAIDAFEFCLIRATQVRWFDERSQQCEVELNRLSPRDYPLAAEIRGKPTYTKSTLAEPAPVQLGTGGAGEDNEVPGDQS